MLSRAAEYMPGLARLEVVRNDHGAQAGDRCRALSAIAFLEKVENGTVVGTVAF